MGQLDTTTTPHAYADLFRLLDRLAAIGRVIHKAADTQPPTPSAAGDMFRDIISTSKERAASSEALRSGEPAASAAPDEAGRENGGDPMDTR